MKGNSTCWEQERQGITEEESGNSQIYICLQAADVMNIHITPSIKQMVLAIKGANSAIKQWTPK